MTTKSESTPLHESLKQLSKEAAEKIVEMYIGHGGDGAAKIASIIEQVFTGSDLFRAGVEAAAKACDAVRERWVNYEPQIEAYSEVLETAEECATACRALLPTDTKDK